MKITKSAGEKNHAKLIIALEANEWEQILDKASTKVSSGVTIAGFREGKAPRDVVIGQIGEARVISEAIEIAIEEYYPKAARQEAIRPVAFPKVTVDKGSLTEPLEFTVEVAVLPEVKLGDYSGIKVKKTIEPIKDDQVEEILKTMQKKGVEFEPVERAVTMGDWAEIDFEGFMGGVAFEGGSSKKHPLIVGDNVFIPGFEENLVGMSVGEEKEIEVTFPKDYHKTEYAGKPAKFKVKLNLVKAVNYPELNDEFAKKSSGLESMEALRADIRKFLETEAEKKANEQMREDAILALGKLVTVDLPGEMIDQELERMLHDFTHQLEASKTTMEEYLQKQGLNEAGLKSQWRESAEQRIRLGLALEKFREAEKIDATEDDIVEEIARLKGLYPQETEAIDKEYASGGNREKLKQMLASRKAIDKLVELATKAA